MHSIHVHTHAHHTSMHAYKFAHTRPAHLHTFTVVSMSLCLHQPKHFCSNMAKGRVKKKPAAKRKSGKSGWAAGNKQRKAAAYAKKLATNAIQEVATQTEEHPDPPLPPQPPQTPKPDPPVTRETGVQWSAAESVKLPSWAANWCS